MLGLTCAAALAGTRLALSDTTRVVDTDSGRVRGALDPAFGVLVFRGIPYAQVARDGGRFRPASAPARWAGIRNALAFGPICPQPPELTAGATEIFSLFATSVAPPRLRADEDCLVLNIWTPTLADQRKRPVMFWIHGGGYSTGTAAYPTHWGTRFQSPVTRSSFPSIIA